MPEYSATLRLRLAALALLTGTPFALGQSCQWINAQVNGPEPRTGAKLAFDSARGVMVLFGGTGVGSYRPDTTYEWDGSAWALVAATLPGGRMYHAMTYDPVRQRTVLFGGLTTTSNYSGDTWTYDGTAWTQVATTGPSQRNSAGLAFDSGRGVCVLFGGYDGTRLGDTWEWNGAAWTQRSPGGPNDPPGRIYPPLAYDASRGVCVLYGGNGPSGYLGDTWEYSGATGTWTQKLVTGPLPRANCSFMYDPDLHVTLMYGGQEPGLAGAADLWQWDGTAWTQLPDGPSPRYNAPLAYDAVRRKGVMYGGTYYLGAIASDTQLYTCQLPAPCYANCDGSTAAPVLNANDFQCFLNKFAALDTYANCDGSTAPPVLNANDFQCFLNAFAAGCS